VRLPAPAPSIGNRKGRLPNLARFRKIYARGTICRGFCSSAAIAVFVQFKSKPFRRDFGFRLVPRPLVALNIQTFFNTPPMAMAAYYIKGVARPQVQLNQIFAGALPFVLMVFIPMALVYVFPGIAL
jgi:TRAP-type C4-dicarboxylate transport system permease large subunit